MKYFIVYDTEFTCWEGSLQRNWNGENEYKEIIQISAFKINENFELIEKFNVFVKPIINNVLSDYCKNLTNIKQTEIDNAKTLEEILIDFNNFIDKNNKIKCWSWGNDMDVILENTELLKLNLPFDYSIGINLIDLFKKNNIDFGNVNSGKLSSYFNLTTENNNLEHNAEYDTNSLYQTIKHFKHLFKEDLF